MMEPFQINVSIEAMPEQLTVVPEVDEKDCKYKILKDGIYMGTVWPDCLDHGVCWFSSDEISEDTVAKIGDAIERHDL